MNNFLSFSIVFKDNLHFVFTRAVFSGFVSLIYILISIYLRFYLFLQKHWRFNRQDLIKALCTLHTVSCHPDLLLRHLRSQKYRICINNVFAVNIHAILDALHQASECIQPLFQARYNNEEFLLFRFEFCYYHCFLPPTPLFALA